MVIVSSYQALQRLSAMVILACLGFAISGCASLPSSGPTGVQIRKSLASTSGSGAVRLIEVDCAAALPSPEKRRPAPFIDRVPPPTDMVGPGDVLDVAIYEAGVTLFGGGAKATSDAVTFDPSAKVEKLPPLRVDDGGDIRLPYTGRLHVAGLTVKEIEQAIRRSLRGFSQNPQILVTVRDVITNSVIVGGEVGRPGRLVLATNRETLSDAIALAGGYKGDAKDLSVRLQRQESSGEFRLSDLLDGPDRELLAYPGDRISVLRSPRSFSVLGAPGRVEQIPFSASSVSLAEAVATAGGASAANGDPAAIFVFRYQPTPDGQPEEPVVYHLNMMTAGAYLLSQRFAMHDKDVLYVGNARANQPSKLIQIISQLFAPIVTVTSAVRTLKN